MSVKRILRMAVLTIIAFPLVGFLVAYFASHTSPVVLMAFEKSWYLNVFFGLSIGTLAGLSAKVLVTRPFMKPVQQQYQNILGNTHLKHIHVWFISFCAGFGEEVLFRGALQPLFGVWITAFIFVGIHGYLNPWNWRISIYGIFMTGVIVILGFMTLELGLLSAMIAHMMIDVVLLYHMIPVKPNQNISSKLEICVNDEVC